MEEGGLPSTCWGAQRPAEGEEGGKVAATSGPALPPGGAGAAQLHPTSQGVAAAEHLLCLSLLVG